MLWRRALRNRGHHYIKLHCVLCENPIPQIRCAQWYCSSMCSNKSGAALTAQANKIAKHSRRKKQNS